MDGREGTRFLGNAMIAGSIIHGIVSDLGWQEATSVQIATPLDPLPLMVYCKNRWVHVHMWSLLGTILRMSKNFIKDLYDGIKR